MSRFEFSLLGASVVLKCVSEQGGRFVNSTTDAVAEGSQYLYINLRRSHDVFVPSFIPSFVCYPCFSSLWPAFTLTVHINAL